MRFERIPLDQLEALVTRFGGSDLDYLRFHHQRFSETQAEFYRTWPRQRGLRLLDVGAHWLHQAAMWARDGFQVTALDLPVTLDDQAVIKLADDLGIRLLPNNDLENPVALAAIANDSFDVMLFTEIIEHLTFNPVNFWKEIYRVLAPGARILVTTPNYYALRGRAWTPRRFITGRGAGLSVDGILRFRTLAHHWKEFSRHEVIAYFRTLSADFDVVKTRYMPDYYAPDGPERFLTRQARQAEKLVSGLRPNLHMEIELVNKNHGITLEPGW